MIDHIGEFLRWATILVVGFGYEVIYYNLLAVGILLILGFFLAIFLRKWDVFLAYMVVIIACLVGSYKLAEYPIAVHPDEVHGAEVTLEPLQKWFETHEKMPGPVLLKDPSQAPYVWSLVRANPRHDARPRPYVPVVSQMYYLVVRLFGKNFVGYRMSSVLIGALDGLFFYLLLKCMFGNPLAFAGAVMLVLNPWHLSLSRIHLPYMATNFYVILTLYIFWKALNRIWLFVLVGILIGFSMPMYPSVKILYFILPSYLIYALKFGDWSKAKVFIGFLLLVLSAYSLLHVQPEALRGFYLYDQGGAGYAWKFDKIVAVVKSVFRVDWAAYTTFSSNNYIELAARFSPWVVVLTLLGLFLGLVRFKDDRSWFLWLWLILALAPTALSTGAAVHRRLTVVIAPMIALACYPLAVLPFRKLKVFLSVALVILSFSGAYVGYFKMYDNLLSSNKFYKEIYDKKMEGLDSNRVEFKIF